MFAVLLPIVGFFIGLALLGKRGNDGIKMVVTSVVCFLIWFWIITAVQQENREDQCDYAGLPRSACS